MSSPKAYNYEIISAQNATYLTSTAQNRFLFFQLATYTKISRCFMRIELFKEFFCLKICSKMKQNNSFVYEPQPIKDEASVDEELYKHLLQNDVIISKNELDDKKQLMHLLSSIRDCRIKNKLLKLIENIEDNYDEEI